MSDTLLDFEAMLAPLDAGEGAGESLREDKSASSLYYRLRDAVSGARDEDRARDSDPDAEVGIQEGWRDVRRLATEALTGKTRDFEVAAWLTEALTRLEGLRGLTASARLLTGLLEQHWDHGHPLPDEDGLDGRSYPLSGLDGGDRDGTVLQPLRRTPLFRRPGGDTLTLFQYESSIETAGIADEERRERRFAQGVIPYDTIQTEARFGRADLTRMSAEAAEALEAWRAYSAAADSRFGMDGPTTRRVSTVLERLVEVAQQLGAEEAGAGDAAAAGEAGAAAAGAAGPGAVTGGAAAAGAAMAGFAVPGGALASREQALEALEKIAEFFRKTEPHSFLAFTLTDAARRGRLPLPKLLEEVLQDETARTAMLTALGIRPGAMEEEAEG